MIDRGTRLFLQLLLLLSVSIFAVMALASVPGFPQQWVFVILTFLLGVITLVHAFFILRAVGPWSELPILRVFTVHSKYSILSIASVGVVLTGASVLLALDVLLR